MFKECEHQRVLLASRFVVWSSFHFRQLCLPYYPSQASPSLALRACFCIWGPFCKDPTMTWLEYHVAVLESCPFFSRTTFTALMFHVLVFRSVIIGLYNTTSHLTYLDNVLNESKTLCLLDFIFPWMESTLTFVRSLQWQLFAVIALGWFRPHCVNPFTAKFSQKQISTKFPTPLALWRWNG